MTSKPKNRPKGRPLEVPGGEAVSFGTWLRRQREAREISLREIADASKISLRYLEAFEQDRFELLPARVFVQGFLREYAKYVGLDPDEVVNHYLASQETLEPEEEVEAAVRREAKTGGSSWIWHLLLVVGVAATLAIAAVLAFESERKRTASQQAEITEPAPPPAPAPASVDDEAEPEGTTGGDTAVTPLPGEPASSQEAAPAQETPSQETPAQEASPPPTSESTAQPGAPEPQTAPLRVSLAFSQPCWVELTVDGRSRGQQEHAAGDSLQVDAERAVVLTLGNAGGVAIRVNGHPFPLNKGPGQVARNIRIDLATAEELAKGP